MKAAVDAPGEAPSKATRDLSSAATSSVPNSNKPNLIKIGAKVVSYGRYVTAIYRPPRSPFSGAGHDLPLPRYFDGAILGSNRRDLANVGKKVAVASL
jgi:hypothetical protein